MYNTSSNFFCGGRKATVSKVETINNRRSPLHQQQQPGRGDDQQTEFLSVPGAWLEASGTYHTVIINIPGQEHINIGERKKKTLGSERTMAGNNPGAQNIGFGGTIAAKYNNLVNVITRLGRFDEKDPAEFKSWM